MIKAVFFDLDDTLLWDKKSVAEAFAVTCRLAHEKYGVDDAELEAAVREEASSLYSSYDTYEFTKLIGINAFEGLWGNFEDDHDEFRKMNSMVPSYRKEAWINGLRRLGVQDEAFGASLAQEFRLQREQLPFVYEETFFVLNQLQGKYNLLLLTNGSPDLQNTKLAMTPEIAPYFDHIIISGAFGRGKPDPSIFEHCLERVGIEKEEAIMVGDNLMTDILGANRVGMMSVWINREGRQKNDVLPDFEISDLRELLTILDSL